MIFLPLAMIFGGVGRRVAGGAINEWFHKDVGDHPVRLFYGLTIALAAFMGGATLGVSALMIPAVWLGTITGNFESLAMGNGEYSLRHDFLGMTLHGVMTTAPCVVAWCAGLNWAAITLIAFGCALAAPCYMFGWWLSFRIGSQTNPNTRMPPGLRGGMQLSEVTWGAVHAGTVFLAFSVRLS